jgi:methionine biosynthesis protein MetW
MQEVKRVDMVFEQALRIGTRIIVGFPNFAYIGARLMLFFRGKSPITSSIPYHWNDTPNVRFLSIRDFRDYCNENRLRILAARYLNAEKEIRLWPNLMALNAIFVLTK